MSATPLLSLLRAWPEQPEASAQLLRSDPERIVHQARRHGLSAWVQFVAQESRVVWPAALGEQLRKDALTLAAGAVRVKAALTRVLEALGRAGLEPPILLKGYGFAARFYPTPLLRPMTDVDLLLPPSAFAKAHEVLLGLGYSAPSNDAVAYHLRHHHHLHYAGDGAPVELHFRPFTGLGGAVSGERWMDRAVISELDGHPVRYLEPTDEFSYLAFHSIGHVFERLSWLYDLKLLFHARPPDVALLMESARAAGLEGPTWAAMHVLEKALGICVDVSPLLPSWAYAKSVSAALTEARVGSGFWANGKWRAFLLAGALASSWKRRLGFLTHHVAHGLRRRVSRWAPSWVPEDWRG